MMSNGFPVSSNDFVPTFGDLNSFFQTSSNALTAPPGPLSFASAHASAPITTAFAQNAIAHSPSAPAKSASSTSELGFSMGAMVLPVTGGTVASTPTVATTTNTIMGAIVASTPTVAPTTNTIMGAILASTPTVAPTTNTIMGATVASTPTVAPTNTGSGSEKNDLTTQNLPSASEAWIKIDPDQSPIKLSIGNSESIISGKVSAIWIKCSLSSGASDPISGSGNFNIFSS